MKNLLLKLILPLTILGLVLAPMVGFGVAVAGLVVVSLLTPEISGSLSMAIGLENARATLTKMLVATYIENPRPSSFLRSFFPSQFVPSYMFSVEVQRGFEKIAVDVGQYTNGNRNQFTQSTERIIKPPYYNEWFSLNEHELYMTVIASLAQGNTTNLRQLMEKYSVQLSMIMDKIERAHEKQCADVLENGIIQLSGNGDVAQIDYKRKSASIVSYNAAHDFSDNAVDPYQTFINACQFLRETGKASGGVFNAIVGDSALQAMLNNTKFLARQDLVNMKLDDVTPPNMDVTGATYHGTITAGSYRVNLWAYPQVYTDANGNDVKYWDTNKICVLPTVTKFVTKWGLVPQLIDRAGNIPQNDAYLLQDFINEEEGYHKQYVKAAPVVIPVAVDQMYTVEVLDPA